MANKKTPLEEFLGKDNIKRVERKAGSSPRAVSEKSFRKIKKRLKKEDK